jgi:hypothetical protein
MPQNNQIDYILSQVFFFQGAMPTEMFCGVVVLGTCERQWGLGLLASSFFSLPTDFKQFV